MPKVTGSKIRILIVLQMLLTQSDENNRLSAQDIIAAVEDRGYKAERKAIYDDIAAIKEMGYDVFYSREAPAGWYIGSRDFELPELKLLIDAVQSSKFITEKKSKELIGKIGTLASEGEAGLLNRDVYIAGRVKTDNERIFYNIDGIHQAIRENKKISFTYFKWDVGKKKVAKNNGSPVIVSPWALVWQDENYYMMAYDSAAARIKHYRVDKMEGITVTGEKRDGAKAFAQIDMTAFAKHTFGMFGGEKQTVLLECGNELIGAILDRFGTDTAIVQTSPERFRIQCEITVSGQFFGWLVGLGPGIRIVSPRSVADEFQERLKAMLD